MQVANVTATKDGETLEESADITDTDLACLLDYADEIVVHEVHDQEWVGDRKDRYPEEWEEKVEMDADESDKGPEANVGESGECRHVDCGSDADVAAKCDTGQVKHYCDDHGHGRRAGNAYVEEWVAL